MTVSGVSIEITSYFHVLPNMIHARVRLHFIVPKLQIRYKSALNGTIHTSCEDDPCGFGARNGSTMDAQVMTTTEGSDDVVVS